MLVPELTQILATADWLGKTINYKVVAGNQIWRFLMVLLVIIVAMAAGKIAQFTIAGFAEKKDRKTGVTILTLFLKCLTRPISVAFFAAGMYLCRLCLIFEDLDATPPVEGISSVIAKGWDQIAKAIATIAVAYAIYQLVDVVEYYLQRWTSRTETKLDDMLVPVIRKSLRVTIAILATIYIVDNVLQQDVKSILLGAGVGGIAIALAAKDTIANFFGSVTIFADRPFQIDELIRVGDYYGPVEAVGFRSTKIRTLEGHLVSVPNSVIANTAVENVSKRPFIRRTANITITYDSGSEKTKKAVDVIKNILSQVPEVNVDPEKPPRVYFSDFNDWSLNIYMSYWVKPADYWLCREVNERINFEIMKRFEVEKIEFAFPSQTLYVKKEQ